jgi:predicted outer membrane lipoprotein
VGAGVERPASIGGRRGDTAASGRRRRAYKPRDRRRRRLRGTMTRTTAVADTRCNIRPHGYAPAGQTPKHETISPARLMTDPCTIASRMATLIILCAWIMVITMACLFQIINCMGVEAMHESYTYVQSPSTVPHRYRQKHASRQLAMTIILNI